MRRFWSLAGAVGWGVLGVFAARGLAQPPGFQPAGVPAGTPTRREVDITAPYAVTPQAGAWMICAHSYTGPTAQTLACQLTEEIRNKQHLAAYVFNHASAERDQYEKEYQRQLQIAQAQGAPPPRHRTVRIEEQCAVLVGGPGSGWGTLEEASAFLNKVRHWPMPELHLKDSSLTPYDMKATIKGSPVVALAGSAKAPNGQPINPFEASFVTRNPAAPAAPPPKLKFDPIWKTLNADEDYSLLKCRQPWTLAVKEYIGYAPVVQGNQSSGFLDKLLGNHQLGEGLSVAGAQAHALAEFLTKLGFQAYVLHTRNSSVVTVGGFRGVDDPEMARTQDRLARFSFRKTDGSAAGIELWRHPLPMEVPHP